MGITKKLLTWGIGQQFILPVCKLLTYTLFNDCILVKFSLNLICVCIQANREADKSRIYIQVHVT